MGGCGGCGPDTCNGPCSTRKVRTSEGSEFYASNIGQILDADAVNNSNVTRQFNSVADALARVIIDNRVIARTVELYELGVVRIEDLITQINADKNNGTL